MDTQLHDTVEDARAKVAYYLQLVAQAAGQQNSGTNRAE
jgi:hypothetical protein